jgi:beta-xylosidase
MVDDGVEDVLVVGGDAAVPDEAVSPCGPVTSTTTTTTTTTTSTTTTTAPTSTTTAPGGTTTTTVPEPSVPTLDPQSSLSEDSPDPAVLKVGNTWYAYSTQVLFVKVPVRTSTDLVSWSDPAEALPDLPSWAKFGSNWAPSVVDVGDGSFVMWYAARDASSDRQCVSRAVATDPAGPFVDELGAAPVCQLSLGGSIDPHVFTDTDGTRWLYWKSDENALGKPAHLWVAKLSSDATTVTGSPVRILAQSASWESPTIEQPCVTRVGDRFYLFYSGGWWDSADYGIGFAIGSSPTGPFDKVTTTKAWLASSADARGPGALDVFEGPNGARWAAYHAWGATVGYADGGARTTRFGVLSF